MCSGLVVSCIAAAKRFLLVPKRLFAHEFQWYFTSTSSFLIWCLVFSTGHQLQVNVSRREYNPIRRGFPLVFMLLLYNGFVRALCQELVGYVFIILLILRHFSATSFQNAKMCRAENGFVIIVAELACDVRPCSAIVRFVVV